MTWLGKRRNQLPSNWGAVRKARLEMDGYRCTALEMHYDGRDEQNRSMYHSVPCTHPATEVHHINGPLDHRLSSLRSICRDHHQQETQAEARVARAKVARKRVTQPHPGLR